MLLRAHLLLVVGFIGVWIYQLPLLLFVSAILVFVAVATLLPRLLFLLAILGRPLRLVCRVSLLGMLLFPEATVRFVVVLHDEHWHEVFLLIAHCSCPLLEDATERPVR